MALLKHYLYGFEVTWIGSVIGFFEMGFLGFVAGFLGAGLKNWSLNTYALSVRLRIEKEARRHLLDKV